MPRLPTEFEGARAEVAALGDEAHYERRSRHVGLSASAMRIISSFPDVKQRSQLAIVFMDSFDLAQQRAVDAERALIASLLGVPQELYA